jgi:hypothetical protein
MSREKWMTAVLLIEEAANAMHQDLSGDERKTLSGRLIDLMDDLRRRAGLPTLQEEHEAASRRMSNPTE